MSSFPRRHRKFWAAGFGLAFFSFGVYYWQRNLPWVSADREILKGDSGKAIEILTEALADKNLGVEHIESMRSLLARAYLYKGALELAEKEYREIREQFPNNLDAAIGLGLLNSFLDRRAFAEDYFREAQKIAPKDIRPYLLLAQTQWQGNANDMAARTLRAGLERFPGDARLLEIQADLDYSRGRYASALSIYETLSALSPTDRQLRVRMALCRLFSGDHQGAEEMFMTLRFKNQVDESLETALAEMALIRGAKDEAIQILARIFTNNNGRVEAGMRWAVLLAQRGDFPEAQKVLDSVSFNIAPLTHEYYTIPQTSSLVDLEQLNSARVNIRIQNIAYAEAQGAVLTAQGKIAEADSAFRRALSLSNDSFGALTGMMELARIKEDSEERLRWANRLVASYNEHPAALLTRADTLIDLGRNPDAIVDAGLAATAYPKLSQAQAVLARAWLMLKNSDKALEAAAKAIALNPGNPTAHLAMADVIASGRGDAGPFYLKSLELEPRWAMARFRYAQWLKSQGRDKESANQFEEARRVEPKSQRRTP